MQTGEVSAIFVLLNTGTDQRLNSRCSRVLWDTSTGIVGSATLMHCGSGACNMADTYLLFIFSPEYPIHHTNLSFYAVTHWTWQYHFQNCYVTPQSMIIAVLANGSSEIQSRDKLYRAAPSSIFAINCLPVAH